MAEALCALVVRDSALDRLHWDVLSADVAARPLPPPDAISRLLPIAKSARLDDATEASVLDTAMSADADVFDTHPTLPERLAALGQRPQVPALPAQTAAEAWLGASLPAVAADLDATWAAERAALWQERHQLLSGQQQRLRELAARRAGGQTLTADEAWEHADLTEDHVGAAESLPLFQALMDDAKHGLAARFAVGRLLTAQDDPAGLELLSEVMAREPSARTMGLLLQQAYHQRRGDKAEARRLQTEQLRHADVLDVALAERNTVRSSDQLRPHGLPAEELAALGAGLTTYGSRIGRAWLLRKELTQFADHPLYVLVAEPAAGRKATEAETAALVQELAAHLELPGEGFIVPTSKENGWLVKQAQQWLAALVYPAS